MTTEQTTEQKTQCPEFPFFGAWYNDACCIDGYLHDLDDCDGEGNVYLNDEQHPCPFCNEKEYLDGNFNDVDKRSADYKQWLVRFKQWQEHTVAQGWTHTPIP